MSSPKRPHSHIFDSQDVDFLNNVKPTKFYVLCTSPRCGGTYIARELWRTGLCGAPHEYFNFNTTMIRMANRLQADSLYDYIQELFACRTSPNGVFGLKAHLDQFVFLVTLSQHFRRFRPVKYIYIERDDVIAQAVSRVIARQTQSWISHQPDKGKAIYKVDVIERAVAELKGTQDRWQELFRNIGIEPLTIKYETFLKNPGKGVEDICAFLDIDLSDKSPTLDLPTIEHQDNPIKAEWIARYKSEKGLTS